MEKDRAFPGDEEVDKRLEKLGLNKQGLIEVAYEVALARKSCTAYDAKNAPGSLAYFSGTKTLREIFCPKGWEVDRKDSVESIINSAGTIKVIFQNVDCASKKSREPKSISKKGPGSRRTVAENQTGFFSNEEISWMTTKLRKPI